MLLHLVLHPERLLWYIARYYIGDGRSAGYVAIRFV